MDEFAELFAKSGITAVYVTHNLNEAVKLAHRVVALSRRPGRIKSVLSIDIPMAERHEGNPALVEYETLLWEQIRDEARAADQEMVDG